MRSFWAEEGISFRAVTSALPREGTQLPPPSATLRGADAGSAEAGPSVVGMDDAQPAVPSVGPEAVREEV
eukprot:2968773-Alexandrium_andersonii.AAC.1